MRLFHTATDGEIATIHSKGFASGKIPFCELIVFQGRVVTAVPAGWGVVEIDLPEALVTLHLTPHPQHPGKCCELPAEIANAGLVKPYSAGEAYGVVTRQLAEDIPTSADKFDRKRDGRDGNNVIDALNTQIKVLSDRSAPKEKRVEALKFVVHFMGDLHQPLHCAERDKDRGGNTRLVLYRGQRRAVNLHAVWDTWILRDMMGSHRVVDYADMLGGVITPSQKKEWSKGTPESWANESHRVAVDVVYRDVPADRPPLTLSKEYIDRATPVVVEQLKRAGVRLAAILNSALH
jgi:hypothetical protein